MPALASLPVPASASLPLVRRILNAGFRLGRPEDAARLAAICERSELPAAGRALALELLAKWARRPGATPSWGSGGRFRRGPPGRRPQRSGRSSPRSSTSSTGRVQTAAIQAASALQIKEAGGPLAAISGEVESPGLDRGPWRSRRSTN